MLDALREISALPAPLAERAGFSVVVEDAWFATFQTHRCVNVTPNRDRKFTIAHLHHDRLRCLPIGRCVRVLANLQSRFRTSPSSQAKNPLFSAAYLPENLSNPVILSSDGLKPIPPSDCQEGRLGSLTPTGLLVRLLHGHVYSIDERNQHLWGVCRRIAMHHKAAIAWPEGREFAAIPCECEL